MTLLSPALSVQRFVVLKSGKPLFDQLFHLGLNIIRGENSSGKSTIADFIFFALGGDLQKWTPEAGLADSAHAQVAINGKIYTLSRDVVPVHQPPLHLFEGTFDDAMRSRDRWLRYPYKRSASTESYSQILFNLLGLPEQKTEAQQNITMHQILRLLYVDQITPVDEIFRGEQFDSRDIRTAVGELLLGIDDLEMHDLRLRLREMERNLSEVSGELRSMFRILGKTGHSDITVVDFHQTITEARTEQEQARREVDELAKVQEVDESRNIDAQTESLYSELRKIKEAITKQRHQEQALAMDLEDSTQFVETIGERLKALSASKEMISILGEVYFKVCPACFQMTEIMSSDTICHLCKAPIAAAEPNVGHLKMREELVFQLRESTRLIEQRNSELKKVRFVISSLIDKRKFVEAQLSAFQRSLHTADAEIELLLQRIGYLDRLVEDLTDRAELARLIEERIALRDRLTERIKSLRDQLEMGEANRENRVEQIKTKISEFCVDILRSDLPLEETFQNADVVDFDFGANKMRANDRARFSASSMTILKNAFVTSLMRLSLDDPKIRWPRFLLLDNIEDKGMQPERSANFQEYLADKLSEIEIDHQVIFTTSMISSNLNDSPYCVGPYFSHEQKTLQFVSN